MPEPKRRYNDRSQPYSAVKSIVGKHKKLPPTLHPHSLRHSFGSLLIAQGLDVVHVVSLMGDTVQVVSKIYAHTFAERETLAMDRISGVFNQISAATPKLLTGSE